MSKEVAKWDEELAKHAKAAAALERPQVSRISIRGGVMTFMDQRIPSLECIVLAAVMENTYYIKKFDPNKPDAPDCFAISEDGEDMVPDPRSFKKQSETCGDCPQNQWGSNPTSPSGKGKACAAKRKLLLMPKAVLDVKDGIKGAELATIDVPVTSVSRWANYVNSLASTEQRPPWGVVTLIKVEPDPKTQLRVNFQHQFNIGDDHLGAIMEKVAASKEILFIGYDKTSDGLSPQTEAMQTGRKY